MKTKPLFFLLLFSSFLSFSQYIEGVVLDADTQKPIEGVHVFMKGINKGTLTDSRGVYYLKFPFKKVTSDTIIFSHLIYKNQRVLFKRKKYNYPVYLRKDVTVLDEIRIIENRNLRKAIRFKKLASMKSGIHSFGAVLNDRIISVVGGDTSFKLDNFKRISEDFPETYFTEILKRNLRNYETTFYKGTLFNYTIATNKWKKEPIKLRERAYHNLHQYKNSLYVFGGKNLSKGRRYEYLDNTIEVLNLEKGTVKTDHTNPHQAVDFASILYNGFVIVFGGSLKEKSQKKTYSNKVHLYNLKTGLWYELENMPTAKEVKGILLGNIVYFIGGFYKKPLSEIETYNLVTKKWQKEGELFYGVSKPAIAHKNHMIYIYHDGKISTYNTKTKELNEYYIDLSVKWAELLYANETLYLLGGFRANEYSIYPSRALYSIDINEFEKTKIRRSKTF